MPLNLFAKDKYVGIDIGHFSVKVAQIERSGNGYKVTAIGSAPTPPNSVMDGVVTDPAAVGATIKQLLRDSKISATCANLAVQGGSVVVRTVKMPKMPESTLRKSIRFEAGRYVPSSVEDSYIECEYLSDVEDNQMEVLVAASPKDMVESRISAATAAGLETEIIDIEAFALYRALIEADHELDLSEEAIGIVDIGSETTHVSVVDTGSFALTRTIPVGGKTLTSALESYFKLSPEEAEEGKKALDLSGVISPDGPMENPPLRVIQPLVDELIREIRRSLNYFQSQQTGPTQAKPVKQIFLLGGGALLSGLPAYIAHKLGMSVNSPSFLENPRFDFDGFETEDDPRVLAVAVGLAMRRAGKAAAAA